MLTQAADNDTDVPTTPTMKVDLSVSQSLNTPSNLDTPKKPAQAVSGLSIPFPQQYLIIIGEKSCPLPSTSTTHVHKGGLATPSSLHTGQDHDLGHTSITNVS
jgi:hypothetical protein